MPDVLTPDGALRPLSVDEVIRMAEAGIIDEDERIELVDGVLVAMSPEGADHYWSTTELTTVVARAYPPPFLVNASGTLPLSDRTFLQPDIVVIDGPLGRGSFPGRHQVVLVVEVAQTSVRRDRIRKAALYAAWGAPVYWVVDLAAREVVVHAAPGPEGYGEVRTLRGGALALPGLEAPLRVEDVLPPG